VKASTLSAQPGETRNVLRTHLYNNRVPRDWSTAAIGVRDRFGVTPALVGQFFLLCLGLFCRLKRATGALKTQCVNRVSDYEQGVSASRTAESGWEKYVGRSDCFFLFSAFHAGYSPSN
jgi:hypothetical protein